MELLTINLNAGELKQFRHGGAGFEIISSLYSINVAFYSTNGSKIDTLAAALSGMFTEFPYGAFDIDNAGQPAQQVQILVFDKGERGGSRRAPGVVQVIDSDKSTTEAGMAFMGVNNSGLPPAGRYGIVMLWNPVASGKKAIVERAYVDTAGTATNIAFGIVTATTGADAGAVSSKLSGGASSLSHFFTDSILADPATLMTGHQLWAPSVAANSEAVLSPKRPVIILPGYGLMIGARVATAQITGTFEFWEQGLT